MKIIVAPDKFKGSLTSFEVCEAIQKGIHQADAHAEVLLFPMADGGDGFASVMKHYLQTTTQHGISVDSLGRDIESSYEWNPTERVAIIEVAACSGLAMLRSEDRNPLLTSTYGTGLQIKDAAEKGAKKIILGLGGTATNDAGTGILAALGFTFLDVNDRVLRPCGENLVHIEKIVPPASLPQLEFVIACDVNNPLYGEDGAAYIFSPQKGATPRQVKLLDKGLRQIAKVFQRHTGKDVASTPGTGAAGGIAAGLMAYMKVSLEQGTRQVISSSGMELMMKDADIVITGEGKIDSQSSRGKIVNAITDLAKKFNTPVIGLCGKLDLMPSEIHQLGLAYAWEIKEESMKEEESMRNASALLQLRSASIISMLKNNQIILNRKDAAKN